MNQDNTKEKQTTKATTAKKSVKQADKPAKKETPAKLTAEPAKKQATKAADVPKRATKPAAKKDSSAAGQASAPKPKKETVTAAKKAQKPPEEKQTLKLPEEKQMPELTVQPAAPLRVLFAASEAAPFVKTGGLADVVGTLPVALKKLEVDVRVILPKYRDIPAEWKAKMQYLTHFYVSMGWRKQYCGIQFVKHENVTFYFVDNEFYFARDAVYADGPEEGERFGFFCRAVLEALPKIDFFPDVLHCNDWQTGMIPVLLKLQYMHLQQYANIRTLYTIHNLKFQGVFDYKQIDDFFGLGMRYFTPEFLEFFGDISFLKGGIVFSDRVSTVSPTYAREIQSPYYGERMDGLLRQRSDTLSGILNGIDYDIWNPASDPHIAAAYDPQSIEGKAECKRRLQRELWLPEQDDVMVVALVSRLTEQKGLSLIERVLNEMMQMPIQLVVVGQGDSHFCEMFTWAQWRYQGKVAVRFEQNEWLAHNVYAGADVYLMPSRFEPCGISQLIALRYGAVPLVRETGGLMDTVESYNKYTDEGTGFSFSNYNAHEMLYTLERAYKYFLDKKLWQRLRARGMNAQFGWSQSALEYKQLYETMAGR